MVLQIKTLLQNIHTATPEDENKKTRLELEAGLL